METVKEKLSSESISKLKDLFDVGTKKIVGYIPLATVRSYSNISFEETVEHIKSFCYANNLKYKIIKTGTTGSGALYVWDTKKLNKFLQDNAKIFEKYKIPTDEIYISKVEHTTYLKVKHPEMYKLIGQSFSDVRFENIFEIYKNVK